MQELRQSVQVSKQEQRAGRQGMGAISHQQERVRAAHQAWTRESSFKIPTALRKRHVWTVAGPLQFTH